MLGRLWRWLRGAPDADDGAFHFRANGRRRAVDPMAVLAVLDAAAPDGGWMALLRLATADPPAGTVGAMAEEFARQKRAAALRLADAACAAFRVEPYADGAGMTAAARVVLLVGFVDHLARLAVRARPFGHSPPPTAASPPA